MIEKVCKRYCRGSFEEEGLFDKRSSQDTFGIDIAQTFEYCRHVRILAETLLWS